MSMTLNHERSVKTVRPNRNNAINSSVLPWIFSALSARSPRISPNTPPAEPGKPAAPLPRLVALAENLVGLDGQQQRENVSEIAQYHEQDVSQKRTGSAGGILHLHRTAGVAPARVCLVVAQQRHHQIQAQGAKSDQRTFLESVVQLLPPERNGAGYCGGFLQNASFPAL